MSRTNNNSKMFCKICFDAKKPEKEYTSHSIKNRDGEVCCPVLKATECRYCHKTGHTLAHCELRNKGISAPKPAVAAAAPKPAAAAAPKQAPSNKFALLDSDNESDNEQPVAKPEEKPIAKPRYERKSTVCERPLNQVFHIVDLSYLAKERERLGQTDPALGKNFAVAKAVAKCVDKDDYNRPDAPRGQDCFYSSYEERVSHRAKLQAEYNELVKNNKPLFAAADEDW